jgi:hypothetical protein
MRIVTLLTFSGKEEKLRRTTNKNLSNSSMKRLIRLLPTQLTRRGGLSQYVLLSLLNQINMLMRLLLCLISLTNFPPKINFKTKVSGILTHSTPS